MSVKIQPREYLKALGITICYNCGRNQWNGDYFIVYNKIPKRIDTGESSRRGYRGFFDKIGILEGEPNKKSLDSLYEEIIKIFN